MATHIEYNQNYHYNFVSVQKRAFVPDPREPGKKFLLYKGMQFKWLCKDGSVSETDCNTCGGGPAGVTYCVDRYAHCKEAYILEGGQLIHIPAELLIETSRLYWPPAWEAIEDNLSGANIEMWTLPQFRSYNPKWHGSTDGTGGPDDATSFCC